MPWPYRVLRQFEKIPTNSSASDFHGAYNKLLNTLFPIDTAFTVFPKYMPGTNEAADFLVLFEVTVEDKPVLIIELESPSDLHYASNREKADAQVRERMRDLMNDCPISFLHAISAMGTKLCFYTQRGPDQPVEPQAIVRDPIRNTDTAPAERWNYDILEAEGEGKFMDVVNEIKQACAGL